MTGCWQQSSNPQVSLSCCFKRYGLNFGWGGPIGDYIGCWCGPIKGNTISLVQGSYRAARNGMDEGHNKFGLVV